MINSENDINQHEQHTDDDTNELETQRQLCIRCEQSQASTSK